MTGSKPLVCWFHECDKNSVPLVGGNVPRSAR